MEEKQPPMKKLLLIALLVAECVFGQEKIANFPDIVSDISGNNIDLKQLAAKKIVVVITLKTAECPVCQQQLIRINDNLHEFGASNVTFLVLSPGSIDKIKKAKSITKFPFPFIMDEDLEISKSLDLIIDEKRILPSILILNEKLEIEWEQRGRNAFFFGDPELMKRIHCYSL